MNKDSELDCYLYYMWNRFSKDESVRIFGGNLGNHIWSQYTTCLGKSLYGAPAILFSKLDSGNRDLLVRAAMEYYS